MVLHNILGVVLLSATVSAPLDTSMLRIDEITVTAPHRHTSPIVSQATVEVSLEFLSEHFQPSLAKSLDAIAGVQAAISALGDYFVDKANKMLEKDGAPALKIPAHLENAIEENK